MGFSAFIDDGYNEQRHIAEAPRLYPAATITFRPMTCADNAAFLNRTRTADDEVMRTEVAKEIAKRLVTWNVLKADDSPLAASVENLLKLRPVFFKRIENIVFGYEAGDAEQRAADLKN